MKAALARAAGYIAPNSYEVKKESVPTDEAAIKAELLANSLRWFTEDAKTATDPVSPALACPECGEAECDNLVVDEDEATCQTCGTHYSLFTPYPVKPDWMSEDQWEDFLRFEAEAAAQESRVICTPAQAEIAGALDLL